MYVNARPIDLSLSRLVCVASIAMWLYCIASYRSPVSEMGVVSLILLLIAPFLGCILGVYLIEYHDSLWQKYVGYLVLYIFFAGGLGGVLFGW